MLAVEAEELSAVVFAVVTPAHRTQFNYYYFKYHLFQAAPYLLLAITRFDEGRRELGG